MKGWKRVLIGGLTVATIGGGASIAARAASGGSPAPTSSRLEPADRHEAEPSDDRGKHDGEARGHEAERNDDRGREPEARGREAEGERDGERDGEREDERGDDRNRGGDEGEMEDRDGHDRGDSGPSDHSGPGRQGNDDEGHGGSDPH